MSKHNSIYRKPLHELILFLTFSFFVVLYVWFIRVKIENEQRESKLQIARSIAATISGEDLKAFEVTASDRSNPQYKVIKKYLKNSVRVNPQARFAYLCAEINGKIYFIADSEPKDSDDYSPPWQEYTEAKPEDRQTFRDEEEVIAEPIEERGGIRISTRIPIKDEVSGKTIAIFGMDFNTKSWKNYLFFIVVQSGLFIVLLSALLYILKTQARNKLLLGDISELKIAGEAIRRSEEMLRSILNSTRDVVWSSTWPELKVLFISPSAEIVFGRPIQEFYNNSTVWKENVHPDDRHLTEIAMLQLQKEGTASRECRIIHPDGRIAWIYEKSELICDENNNPVRVDGIATDITERKRSEEELRRSKQQYDHLVSKIPVGIYILHSKPDHSFVLDYVSPRMSEMLDLSAERLLSDANLVPQSIHPDDLDDFVKLNMNGIKLIRPFDWKGRIWVDGKIKWLHFKSSPEMLENGDILWHGLIVDITENVKAELEIKSKNDELQKSNAEKDKLFSIVAHDLRSPFNSFLGLTQIMAEEVSSLTMDQIQEIAVSMRNSATNLYGLIENLLQWARIHQGAIPFNPELVRLRKFVEESITIVLETAKLKNITISSSIPDDLSVYTDTNILQTIIRNLVTNAVKFTPKGGRVNVSAKTSGDNMVELSIHDTGIGMSQSMVQSLFQIDVQTSRSGTEGESSTGLGLVLCNDFIKMHGGTIWVESEENKGSTFYFTIPCSNFRF
jgi:PAS domain S-box-containing protein